MKTLAASATLASLTALTSSAEAENVGRKGSAVFGAERLSGLYFARMTEVESRDTEVERDFTEVGLGWGVPGPTPYTVPRLGFDFFAVERLSVGGAIAYATLTDGDGEDVDDPVRFLFAQRVGYALPLGPVFTFWPRGGLTLHDYDGTHEHGLAVTVEAMFVASSAPHFGLGFGPVLDLSIKGERGTRETLYRLFGLTTGLVVWL